MPARPNHTWSMDFMSDALTDGRKIRVLNVTDDFNREALAIEVALSFPAHRVIRTLGVLEEEYGLPNFIRVDNGPEFIANNLAVWCKQKKIRLKFIQPGKPAQNAYIERFNRIFREDILDAYWFEDLEQVRLIAEQWRMDYNCNHPHSSLKGLSPVLHYQKAIKEGNIEPREVDINQKKLNLEWSDNW